MSIVGPWLYLLDSGRPCLLKNGSFSGDDPVYSRVQNVLLVENAQLKQIFVSLNIVKRFPELGLRGLFYSQSSVENPNSFLLSLNTNANILIGLC